MAEQSRGKMSMLITLLLVGLGLYFFSFGPVVYLDSRFDLPISVLTVLRVLYYPHIILYNAWDVYENYGDWWMELGESG